MEDKKLKKVKWYHYLFRFFFLPCCSQCTNIAHREERYAGRWENRCLNHLIIRSSISVPLDGFNANAWDYNPAYTSIFQRLWVKLKLKENGRPVKR